MSGIGNRIPQHMYSQVPDVRMARSKFNRSFPVKDTFDFDYLVPLFVDEILPGDTVNLSLNFFARLSTQIRPTMDNMYLDFHFFFAPNRLLWNNWEKFCGAQTNPGDSISYVLPSLDQFPAGGPEVGTIYDKMGLPTDVAGAWTLGNTLPLRMYNRVYNEWYRDENLQNSVTQNMDDGPDQIADYTLLKRGKRFNFFTGCLPFLQKGTAVTLPLGSVAPVITTGATPVMTDGLGNAGLLNYNNTGGLLNVNPDLPSGAVKFGATTGLQADLTNATAATINALRQAFQVQGLLELDARGGTRYVELLAAHFNVTSPDFRLQRTEFLGSGSAKINSQPVAQTAPTAGSNPQGQLAGFGTDAVTGIGFTKSFVEHGYIMCIVSARADITYQQGLSKMWQRSTRYDFFWPKLQELGEQAVLNSEIYLAGAGGTDTSVFGYQERYGEYRNMLGGIKGQFRSTYATSLDTWHLAEEFASVPALNSTFIVSNTPVARILAINTEPHLLFDGYVNYIHARPMVSYAVPVTLGRF